MAHVIPLTGARELLVASALASVFCGKKDRTLDGILSLMSGIGGDARTGRTNDQNRDRDRDRDFWSDLDKIKEFVITPIVASFEGKLQRIEHEIRQQGEANNAIMRTIQDPDTGYVPRAQIELMAQNAQLIQADLRARVERSQKDLEETQRRTTALERNQLPPWSIGVLGTIISAGAIIAGHFWK